MDVDQSLSSSSQHSDKSIDYDKENDNQNTVAHAFAPTSPIPMAKVLAPVILNRSPDSPSQSHKPAPMDISIDEEKLADMMRAERRMSGFGGGVRRESFPGKHSHTPDASFNCEEMSIGDKTYSSDISHEGMSFVYNARSSTPVPSHEIALPSATQRTKTEPDMVVEPPSHVPSESTPKDSLPVSTLGPEGLGTSYTASNPRTTHPRSPLAFEVDNDTQGRDKLTSRETEFVLPQRKGSSERAQLKSGPIPPVTGLKSVSARAAALRFILPEDSLMEMDSILDVQFPGGIEDEFTAAFARLALGGPSSEPQVTKPQATTSEPSRVPQERGSTGSNQPGSLATIKQTLKDEVGSTKSNPTSGEVNGSYLEDEHTLNLASLGLNGVGNTLLLDMSLDQLRSKPSEVEPGNATFGGASFAIPDSSATESSTSAVLEVQTPKRTTNLLPQVEDGEMGVEATVKKPRTTNGRVVSDAVVDALRSGRALHRATNSIASVSDAIRLTNMVNRADETPSGKQMWPGSTASLRRTGSFASYSHTAAETRQYPGSAVPLQRTRSTMSLRRTSSVISYQPEFMRPYSRSSVADVDSDDERPYTPPVPTMSRGSSRRSSIYALPEPNDRPTSYFERPSSVASIHDRPTSAASMRPTSAASIRPPSVASICTASTRPTSAASSLRSGSATSSRRVSGVCPQPSPVESEFAEGIHKVSPASILARDTEEAHDARSTKVEGGATQDRRGAVRSGIRQPSGSSVPRAAGTLGLAPPKALGSKILPRSTVSGAGSAAKTMSAASGRAVPKTAGSGIRSAASTLRSQSSVVRTRATTLGLFAPDGGPGAGQEPRKLTHKASSSSISSTPSTIRSLRPPATTSSIRTLGARGINDTARSTRPAATAGSIASLREAIRSKEPSKR
ncbi:unnamed protein product [Rhizoctonia solani]|uniref:Uncharacterized protein n=1 Tax=Rhizoctonia solani TaxID=456999 RepID=A0A8H3DKV9_9AGAM|nr:unnamed protein product [Rhizoctonia solani]